MNTKPDIYSDNPVVTLEYMIAVMQAANDSNVQCRDSSWVGVGAVHNPWRLGKVSWNWHLYQYRISPDSRPKKTVPMERDDYPPVFWIRSPYSPAWHFLPFALSFENIGLIDADGSVFFKPLSYAAEHYQYSTDRVNFKPCTKEVAE